MNSKLDIDLEWLRDIERYRSAVKFLLEPLLKNLEIGPMPCKHGRTFEIARRNRLQFYEEIGEDAPDEDISMEMPDGYCDCGRFNRRNELQQIADVCIKRALTHQQMTEIAAILIVITPKVFTFNHFNRAMIDLFCGEHKDFVRALKRQRDQGASFAEAMPGLVARWQWRMMPNA